MDPKQKSELQDLMREKAEARLLRRANLMRLPMKPEIMSLMELSQVDVRNLTLISERAMRRAKTIATRRLDVETELLMKLSPPPEQEESLLKSHTEIEMGPLTRDEATWETPPTPPTTPPAAAMVKPLKPTLLRKTALRVAKAQTRRRLPMLLRQLQMLDLAVLAGGKLTPEQTTRLADLRKRVSLLAKLADSAAKLEAAMDLHSKRRAEQLLNPVMFTTPSPEQMQEKIRTTLEKKRGTLPKVVTTGLMVTTDSPAQPMDPMDSRMQRLAAQRRPQES